MFVIISVYKKKRHDVMNNYMMLKVMKVSRQNVRLKMQVCF